MTSDQPKQKTDYSKSTQCQNKRNNKDIPECKARLKDCLYYDRIKESGGTGVGICKLRYKSKQEREKQDKAANLKKIQDISTYSGRR